MTPRDEADYTQGFEPTQFDAPCAVFALCDRQAVTTIPHPILGPVPACQRCADKIESIERATVRPGVMDDRD